jgi:hypothetical protein
MNLAWLFMRKSARVSRQAITGIYEKLRRCSRAEKNQSQASLVLDLYASHILAPVVFGRNNVYIDITR